MYSNEGETLELFDKESDPTEQNSVARDKTELADELRAEAANYLERKESPWGDATLEVEINEMELQQLRALGYGIQ